MTEEERLAYQYGQNAAQRRIRYAPAYDSNMRSLVSDTRTEAGGKRNQRNMRAWYEGYLEQCKSMGDEIGAAAQKCFDELYVIPDGLETSDRDHETRVTLNHLLEREQPETGGMNLSM